MGTRMRSLPYKFMIKLKSRSDIHWARKIWHMTGVFALFLVYTYFPLKDAQRIFFLSWLLFAGGDFVRLKIPLLNQKILQIFYPILRDQEQNKWAGTTYLLSGVLFVVLFFSRDVVSLTLLFLAFGDPLASYFGLKWGKRKIFNNKTLEGTLGAFLICWLLSILYLKNSSMNLFGTFFKSIFSALIGSLSEMIPIGDLDDNFTLPIISALCLTTLFLIF